jgi:membrane fusion protein (multidrug efflux system)
MPPTASLGAPAQGRASSAELEAPDALSKRALGRASEELSPRSGPQGPAANTNTTVGTKGGLNKRALGLLTALVALLGLGSYFYLQRGLESTDNAQIDADLVAVPARAAGTVEQLHFAENQRVHAGDLLAELDAREARAKLAQAEANLSSAVAAADAAHADAEVGASNAVEGRALAAANAQTIALGTQSSEQGILEGSAQAQAAEAQLAQAKLDAERARELFSMGAYTKVQRDQAETALSLANASVEAQRARVASLRNALSQSRSRVAEASANLRRSNNVAALVEQAQARAKAAEANVEIARAARDLAALDLSYTRILAPQDGVVSKKTINVGQNVAKGQTVVQLVPDERWVTANFKETQVEQMRVGQSAYFSLDAYPGVELEGDIESFSGATGSRFTLLPPDNATGNFTKVVQRVPVRVRVAKVPKGVELRPGMSVELTVDTRHHQASKRALGRASEESKRVLGRASEEASAATGARAKS